MTCADCDAPLRPTVIQADTIVCTRCFEIRVRRRGLAVRMPVADNVQFGKLGAFEAEEFFDDEQGGRLGFALAV